VPGKKLLSSDKEKIDGRSRFLSGANTEIIYAPKSDNLDPCLRMNLKSAMELA